LSQARTSSSSPPVLGGDDELVRAWLKEAV